VLLYGYALPSVTVGICYRIEENFLCWFLLCCKYVWRSLVLARIVCLVCTSKLHDAV